LDQQTPLTVRRYRPNGPSLLLTNLLAWILTLSAAANLDMVASVECALLLQYLSTIDSAGSFFSLLHGLSRLQTFFALFCSPQLHSSTLNCRQCSRPPRHCPWPYHLTLLSHSARPLCCCRPTELWSLPYRLVLRRRLVPLPAASHDIQPFAAPPGPTIQDWICRVAETLATSARARGAGPWPLV
jgi:hypothetical protein